MKSSRLLYCDRLQTSCLAAIHDSASGLRVFSWLDWVCTGIDLCIDLLTEVGGEGESLQSNPATIKSESKGEIDDSDWKEKARQIGQGAEGRPLHKKAFRR